MVSEDDLVHAVLSAVNGLEQPARYTSVRADAWKNEQQIKERNPVSGSRVSGQAINAV